MIATYIDTIAHISSSPMDEGTVAYIPTDSWRAGHLWRSCHKTYECDTDMIYTVSEVASTGKLFVRENVLQLFMHMHHASCPDRFWKVSANDRFPTPNLPVQTCNVHRHPRQSDSDTTWNPDETEIVLRLSRIKCEWRWRGRGTTHSLISSTSQSHRTYIILEFPFWNREIR